MHETTKSKKHRPMLRSRLTVGLTVYHGVGEVILEEEESLLWARFVNEME